MGFSDLLNALAAADLWPVIVEGKVVLHGDQKNVTPEIEAARSKHRESLYNFAAVEGGGDDHDGGITEIKGPKR